MGEPTETEVKILLASPAAAREALARVGATLARPRHFEDNVLFDDSGGSLRESGGVLRLRSTAHENVLTLKGPRHIEEGMKTREERQTLVAEPEALRAILARLGYRPVFRYQPYRASWTPRAWGGGVSRGGHPAPHPQGVSPAAPVLGGGRCRISGS